MDVPTCVKFLLDGNFLSFIQNILITHEVKVTISFTKEKIILTSFVKS